MDQQSKGVLHQYQMSSPIKMNCEFSNIGCLFRGTNAEMEPHMQENMHMHMIFLADAANKQQGLFTFMEKAIQKQGDELELIVGSMRFPEQQSKQLTRIASKSLQDFKKHTACKWKPSNNSTKAPQGGHYWKIENFKNRIEKKELIQTDFYLNHELRYKMSFAFNHPNFLHENVLYCALVCGDKDYGLDWPVMSTLKITFFNFNDRGEIVKAKNAPIFKENIMYDTPTCDRRLFMPLASVEVQEILDFVKGDNIIAWIVVQPMPWQSWQELCSSSSDSSQSD